MTYTDTRAITRTADGSDQYAAAGHLHSRASPTAACGPSADAGNLFDYESGRHAAAEHPDGQLQYPVHGANLSLQGNYSYNTAKDLPATPSDPYDFALDWARSSLQRKHRFMLVGSMVAPWGLQLSPFITLQSGAPYDVTLGRDLFGSTLKNARPAFAPGPGDDVLCQPGFGCFDTSPSPGGTFVPRNYLTSAGMVSVNLRLARTFGFGGPRGRNSGTAGHGWSRRRRRRMGGFGGGGGGGDRGGRGGGGGGWRWNAHGRRRPRLRRLRGRKHERKSLQCDVLRDGEQYPEPYQPRRICRA